MKNVYYGTALSSMLNMRSLLLCGNKIKNVTRALAVAILFQISFLLPYEPQSENAVKQIRRGQFKRRQKSSQKERRKEYNRTLNTDKKVRKDKKQHFKFVHQGVFSKDPVETAKIKNSIANLFVDVEHQLRESFSDPEILAAITTRVTAFISAVHLLKDEKKPSKIIAILTLATTSIAPEISHKSVRSSLNFTSAQIAYFKSRFGFNPFVRQAEFDDNDKEIQWLADLPKYLSNWEAARQSPFFEKISELISVVATMGLMDGKHLNITVKGVKLFRLGTLRKHADVTDLLSAILSTLEYFISGGYEFFKTGNPRKFLFDGEHAREFDELYEMLLEATPHAKSMNLPIMKVEFRGEKVIMDDVKYLEHLESAIKLCKDCTKLAKNQWQKQFFQTRLDKMIGWRADYNARRSNGKFRKAPLSIWIYGKSGVGKSSLSQLLIKSLLRYMGVPEDEVDRIASINEQDKYDSTVTGGVHAYLTDDVMNTKAEYLESAPTQKIVDHNNNAPLFANKAEIEGKGVTPHNPKITCYTSNCKIEQVANQYSNCTESIRRRMIINLDVRIKPEYCIPGETRMDSAKVIAKFGSNPIPDIWDIVISECSSQANLGMIELGQNFQPSMVKGHRFNIYETLKYCYGKADAHMKNQDVLQEIQTSLVEKMEICETCRRVGVLCECEPGICPPCSEAQGIISCDNSVATMDLVERLNDLGSRSDNDWSAPESEGQEYEIQADFVPPPTDWFPTPPIREPINLDAPIELRAIEVPFWSLLRGMNGREVVRTLQAPFEDLVKWMEFMPTFMLNFGDFLIARVFTHRQVRRVYWALWSHVFSAHIRNVILFCTLGDVIVTGFFFIFLPYNYFMVAFSLFQVFLGCTAVVLIVKWYRDRMSLLEQIGGSVQHTYREIRKANWKKIAGILAGAVISFKVLQIICNVVKARRTLNAVLEHQSALEPENEQEVRDRDSKVSDWAVPAFEELHMTHKGRTITLDQLRDKVKKNLYHVTMVAEDGSKNRCDGLVVEGNNMLLPLHVFGSKTKLKATCRLKAGDNLNTVWSGHLGLNFSGVIEGLDLVLVNCPFLRPHASLIDNFPTKITHSRGGGAFVYREVDGAVRDDKIGFQRSESHPGGSGYKYKLPYNTFNGLCMGVLIGNFDVPCISGVHLLGMPNTPIGIALTVTQGMLQDLRKALDKKPVLSAMSNGDFPKEMYGVEIVNQSTPIHPNSPLNYLPKYSRITPLGNCPGRSSHTKSTVHKTIISDLVEEVCGVPCKWGPPKFNAKRQWQATLQYSANTPPGFDPDLLEWAMNDYKQDLVNAFTNPKNRDWIKREFKPLNDMEILAGRDGARFLDAIPKDTSKGFPLSGPKEEWIERLDPNTYEEFNCPVACRQEVWDEAERMAECFRRGERGYAIFKACVKDEATPLGKEKVRVFQAAPWAFQLLVRKYYLPLARLMGLFPKQSECAVGINAHGPEWDEYAKYMKDFGEDRIFAGDYSKYDITMPAQTIMATFKVFIDVCAECGDYSDDDLVIMAGIATEISYSITAYNGDLLEHLGVTPSGVGTTVQQNGSGNSINLRMGYAHEGLKQGYTLATLPKFKVGNKFGTYGDDVKGSTKKGFGWFNHLTFAAFMKDNGIVFTMPDKSSTPTKFMHDDNADFLKRKNVYNPETGLIHGALCEDSIFKSLHCVMKSKIGAKQHAAGNIEGALREWFHYGREVFTLRHKQMIEIATRSGINNLSETVNEEAGVVMNTLYDDYDARLAQFKAKHCKSE